MHSEESALLRKAEGDLPKRPTFIFIIVSYCITCTEVPLPLLDNIRFVFKGQEYGLIRYFSFSCFVFLYTI